MLFASLTAELGPLQTLTATLPLSQASLPVCLRCCSSGWALADCGHDLLWKAYSPAAMRSVLLLSVLHLRWVTQLYRLHLK